MACIERVSMLGPLLARFRGSNSSEKRWHYLLFSSTRVTVTGLQPRPAQPQRTSPLLSCSPVTVRALAQQHRQHHLSMSIEIQTPLGNIKLRLRPDAAPKTVEYIVRCINAKLYDERCFYRSDFVIQCGLHGSNVQNPFGNISVNETRLHTFISNQRGTAAIAHWDVPDCGNTEFFINLQDNSHLDEAYGGYCVFAQVGDDASFATVDKIAAAVKAGGGQTAINRIVYSP